MEKLKIDNIKQMVKDGKIRWTNHVIVRLFQRNISQEDIENALLNGEIIEEYAGMIAGGAATIAILGMAAEFVLGGAGLYELILSFSQSIC